MMRPAGRGGRVAGLPRDQRRQSSPGSPKVDRAFCPSIEYIEKILRPVFIILGLGDTVIEVENGRFLHNKLNSLSHYPGLWVHAGHNDIEEKCRATLMAKIPAFLEYAKRNRGGDEKVD